MTTIWTNGYHCSSRMMKAAEEGLLAAKKGEHVRAFDLFQEVYTAMNWEAPEKDTELKFIALRLLGHAGYEGKQYRLAQDYYMHALGMGERLYPYQRAEEKGRVYYRLSQCHAALGNYDEAKKAAEQGMVILKGSSPYLEGLLRKLVHNFMQNGHATVADHKGPNES